MSHIKLTGIDHIERHARTNMYFALLPTFDPVWSQKVKTTFFLKVAMFHIKLNEAKYRTNCKQNV